MPVLSILLIVKVFTPLNQPINFLIKFSIMHLYQVLVIKRIVIELLQLFRHLVVDLNISPFAILLLDNVCVFGVPVELAQPSDFTQALFSFGQSLSFLGVEMERFWLV